MKKNFAHEGKRIVEGSMGLYHYHIAPADRVWESYCGAQTMERSIPWDHWNLPPSHIPNSYCKKCEEYR